MGKAYEATVEGKRYYLMAIGEKERCMVAISRLLRFGSPLKTKGPEGAEQAPAGGPDEEAGPTPPSEKPAAGEEGGEELTEARILEAILREADTKRASNFELALVLAWYNVFMPNDDEEMFITGELTPEAVKAIKADKAMYEGALKAINENKAAFRGKSAYKLQRDYNTTSFWKSFGATDNTPKTDVMLGSARVSVKAGNAQLLSAGKNESEATLAAAIKTAPGVEKLPLYKELQNTISQFVQVGYTKTGTVGGALKKGKDATLIKLKHFIKRCATHVLSTSANFTSPQLHKIDNNYSDKVGDQVRIQVRFKSTSEKLKGEKTGRYRYWSALSGIIDPSKLKEEDLTEQGNTELPIDVDVVGDQSVNFNV